MYSLVGINGNAFCIMGHVSHCMKKEGKTKEEIKEYTDRATSGDYSNLICESQKMIDYLNGEK